MFGNMDTKKWPHFPTTSYSSDHHLITVFFVICFFLMDQVLCTKIHFVGTFKNKGNAFLFVNLCQCYTVLPFLGNAL